MFGRPRKNPTLPKIAYPNPIIFARYFTIPGLLQKLVLIKRRPKVGRRFGITCFSAKYKKLWKSYVFLEFKTHFPTKFTQFFNLRLQSDTFLLLEAMFKLQKKNIRVWSILHPVTLTQAKCRQKKMIVVLFHRDCKVRKREGVVRVLMASPGFHVKWKT